MKQKVFAHVFQLYRFIAADHIKNISLEYASKYVKKNNIIFIGIIIIFYTWLL